MNIIVLILAVLNYFTFFKMTTEWADRYDISFKGYKQLHSNVQEWIEESGIFELMDYQKEVIRINIPTKWSDKMKKTILKLVNLENAEPYGQISMERVKLVNEPTFESLPEIPDKYTGIMNKSPNTELIENLLKSNVTIYERKIKAIIDTTYHAKSYKCNDCLSRACLEIELMPNGKPVKNNANPQSGYANPQSGYANSQSEYNYLYYCAKCAKCISP